MNLTASQFKLIPAPQANASFAVMVNHIPVATIQAADGQSTYEAHRENCGRKCDAIAKGAFLDYVQKRLQEHHWSLDACFGRALVTGEFQRGEMVCTKTLLTCP